MKPEADTPAAIRRGSLLRFFFVLCLASISVPAIAEAATFPAAAEASPLANPFGVDLDSLDFLTADDAEEDLLQDSSTPTRLPGGPEQVPNVSADRANLPSRCDQETPQTTTTTLHPIALRRPGIVPAFLFPIHSSDSLHEHIRERAPPTLT